jgi:Competence protein CoiA-like family
MPLRCVGPSGQSIQSFDLPEAEWLALRLENRRSRQLRMPCCDASVVMKTSTRGLNFFSHKSRGPCQSAPETEAHLALKTLAAQAARRAGWTCETEVSGSSPSGETWAADVLACKGQAKIAIEIQWSGQTNEESRYRLERYRQSGVRCLWLFRRRGFPVSEDFPAACIGGDIATGFEAHLDKQTMPLDEFLDAVLARRLRYGIPVGAKAVVRIQSGVIGCWKCGVVTRIVTFIEVFVGPHRFQLRVSDLTDFPDLWASCQDRIPKGSSIGVIKPRYSKTQERSYLSNGCNDCDALIGEHFEHRAWYDEAATLAEFQITISEIWREAIDPDEHGWAVFEF